MMKTFAVYPLAAKPTIKVRTDNQFEVFTYNHKRQADRKILELVKAGYTLDATHETMVG